MKQPPPGLHKGLVVEALEHVQLRLCRPFLGDEKKEQNAQASLDYLKSDLGKAAYPDDLTCVNVAPMPSSAPMDVDSDQEMYDDDG